MKIDALDYTIFAYMQFADQLLAPEKWVHVLLVHLSLGVKTCLFWQPQELIDGSALFSFKVWEIGTTWFRHKHEKGAAECKLDHSPPSDERRARGHQALRLH